MNIERVFDQSAKNSIDEVIHAYLNEKIDNLISQDYSNYKVNTAASHDLNEEEIA